MAPDNTDENDIEVTDSAPIAPCERRVVSVEPITGDHGSIKVQAVYRHGGAESDRIDHHTFSLGYHYLADDRSCSLGMNKWISPSDSVTAVDMSILKYVVAYFNQYRLSVDVSIPISEHQLSNFEDDASLEIALDSVDADDVSQRVEGP